MMQLLNCPVCGYKEIEGNTCPNCDTDLSLIRALTDLPLSNPQVTQKAAGWQVAAALLILIIGVCLGTLGSFLFLQPSQLLTTAVNSPNPIVRGAGSIPSSMAPQPAVKRSQQLLQPTRYIVKPGDSLSKIAERFYGNTGLWASLVQANPKVKGREDFLGVGELLLIPRREEACNGSF